MPGQNCRKIWLKWQNVSLLLVGVQEQNLLQLKLSFFLIQILKVEGFFFYLCANRAVKVSTSNYKTVSVWREGMFSERLFLLGNRDCLCTGV